ncbi:MAG: L-threonylcarbamoyladenylate synthase [Actinomycetota bacterium]
MTVDSLRSRITTDVEAAAEVLRRGGLIGLPTETVYGLGADASSSDAVGRIFAAKGRPAGHPLIVHLASVAQVPAWADLDDALVDQVAALAEACWPGPLTVIVPRSHRVAPEAVGGRTTIGLRVPDHPVALALLDAFGGGVAAPSANRFGKVSPTTAAHVLDDLGERVDLVLDGGPTTVGVESTIVELGPAGPTMLRPGGVTIDRLSAVLGRRVVDGRGGESRASGMLASHYAPTATVELLDDVQALAARMAELVDGDRSQRVGVVTAGAIPGAALDLGPWWQVLPAEADGFAAELYGAFRTADAAGVERLLVIPPRSGALVDAVLDRLAKAAGAG